MHLEWLAWLYWNPPREAFTVPWIDRPVMWYGITFVTGFILGYFIIIPILSHFLRQTKKLSSLDIINWSRLIDELRSESSPLAKNCWQQLDPFARKQLQQPAHILSNHSGVQAEILKTFNHLLQTQKVQREDLEHAFKGAIASVSQTSHCLADRLCWFIVTGTLVGARLGAVFFYDWPYFKQHPMEIFQVWKGGLASHGGVVGVMIALLLYTRYMKKWLPDLTFLRLLDFVAIPSALAACFIRLGNFMNQEILGTPSSFPWAVLFGHPADGSLPLPRHPVQLYEAFAYLLTFCFLILLWKRKKLQALPGTYVGYLFIFIFSSRFILEFWKASLDSIIDHTTLQMGQWLSIPFVLVGLLLVLRKQKNSINKTTGSCCKI